MHAKPPCDLAKLRIRRSRVMSATPKTDAVYRRLPAPHAHPAIEREKRAAGRSGSFGSARVPLLREANVDFLGLRLRRKAQSKREHSVLDICLDGLGVDHVRDEQRSRELTLLAVAGDRQDFLI